MAASMVYAPQGIIWESAYRSKKADALRMLLAKLNEEVEEAEE